jgi:hypothetical protein
MREAPSIVEKDSGHGNPGVCEAGDERSGSLFSYLNLEARVGKAARCLLPGRFISTDLPLMGRRP